MYNVTSTRHTKYIVQQQRNVILYKTVLIVIVSNFKSQGFISVTQNTLYNPAVYLMPRLDGPVSLIHSTCRYNEVYFCAYCVLWSDDGTQLVPKYVSSYPQ